MARQYIHMISGPRNISTALMYAFGNRDDMDIIDEPFYASYLTSHPEVDHPGRAEVLQSQSSDVTAVIQELAGYRGQGRSLFIKNMAHHLDGLDWSFMLGWANLFLIRNPRDIIASFARVVRHPTILDIGIEMEAQVFAYLKEMGERPVVINSDDIKARPEDGLRAMCAALDVSFSKKMLHWTPGPRAEDGVWAKYWYHNVHQSSGLSKRPLSQHPLPKYLEPLVEEAAFYFEKLNKHAIQF